MKNNNGTSILKHFFLIGSSTLINLFLGLFTTPLITRIVNPVEYGQLSIFTMYSNIGLLVLCLGLDQALVRYYYENDSVSYKKGLLFKCIRLPIVISSLLSIIIIILSYFKIVNFEFNTFIIVNLCIYTIIQILYRFSIAVVRLEHNSKLYSKLNVLVKLLYIILVFPLLILIKKDYLNLLVISTVLSTFICLVISIIAQLKIWNCSIKKDDSIKIISIKQLLKYSYPFIISMSITTLFQAIDKISINYYYSYYEVGIYSSTMSLVHIFAIIQTTFNTLWMPMAVEHYTKMPEDRDYYKKAHSLITVVMFFLGLSLIFVKDIFAFLLGAKYREAAMILPFLIFNPIMYTISETTVCGLVFKKKSKMQILVALGACLTNIIGNYFLVPSLGCKGAAISTGISYIVFFSLRTILSNKYFYVDFNLKKFYLITFLTSIYALYNTFFSFNIFCVIGYLFNIFILYLLYKDTIKYCFEYIKKRFILIIKRRTK